MDITRRKCQRIKVIMNCLSYCLAHAKRVRCSRSLCHVQQAVRHFVWQRWLEQLENDILLFQRKYGMKISFLYLLKIELFRIVCLESSFSLWLQNYLMSRPASCPSLRLTSNNSLMPQLGKLTVTSFGIKDDIFFE